MTLKPSGFCNVGVYPIFLVAVYVEIEIFILDGLIGSIGADLLYGFIEHFHQILVLLAAGNTGALAAAEFEVQSTLLDVDESLINLIV